MAAKGFKLHSKNINGKLWVLGSRGDKFTSHRCSEAIAKYFDVNVSLHLTAGHDLCLDDPDWVIKQINDAISSN